MTGETRAGSRTWLAVAPALLAAAWGGNHFAPLLVYYVSSRGYSVAEVDLFFATYVFGLVPGFLFAGRLSDRFGRRRVLIAGVVVGILGSTILAAGADSAALLAFGRFIAGASVSTSMVAGSSWIKELTIAQGGIGARRAAVTMTLGFGVGAVVAGILAQWAAYPSVLPYLVHISLSVAALVPVLVVREHRPKAALSHEHLSLTPEARRRLLRVVLPFAPWVFAGPAVAIVVAPVLLDDAVGDYGIVFAAAATLMCLGGGVLVQPYVPRIAAATGGRQGAVSLASFAIGIAVLELAAQLGSVAVGVVAAIFLGLSYGIGIVSGLAEVQHVAPPNALGILTGIYYSLTYAGFFLPLILALLATLVDYSVLLAIVASGSLICAKLSEIEVRRSPYADPLTPTA